MTSLDVVVCVATEATAEAGNAGAAGGVGDDHLLGAGVLLLYCGHDVVGLDLGCVGLVDGGLLGVAPVGHLLQTVRGQFVDQSLEIRETHLEPVPLLL